MSENKGLISWRSHKVQNHKRPEFMQRRVLSTSLPKKGLRSKSSGGWAGRLWGNPAKGSTQRGPKSPEGTDIYVNNLRIGSVSISIVAVVILHRTMADFCSNQTGIGPDGRFNLIGHIGVLFEEGLGIVAALTDALAVIGIPRA